MELKGDMVWLSGDTNFVQMIKDASQLHLFLNVFLPYIAIPVEVDEFCNRRTVFNKNTINT